MLSALFNIIEVIANIPAYILYAIETLFNILMEGITAVFTAASSLISLPEIPTIPYLSEINWFYPVGSIIAVLGTMVVGYSAFLAVRWIFKWAGAL